MIAEALMPVFFVMSLGYFAGARRIIDNQQVASLTVLVMTFALPAALFVGVAQTSRSRGSRFIAPAKICRLPRPQIDPQPNYSRRTCRRPRMADQR
jgi:predicted permease